MNASSCKATLFFHKKIQKFSCDLMLRPGWGKLVLNGFNFSPWHDRKKCCVSIWIQKALKYIIYVTESLDQFILNKLARPGADFINLFAPYAKTVCAQCPTFEKLFTGLNVPCKALKIGVGHSLWNQSLSAILYIWNGPDLGPGQMPPNPSLCANELSIFVMPFN